jgi:spermidine synthase
MSTAGIWSERSEKADRQVAAVYGLFFLSGVPALIYQLAWQRSLYLIFGVNIESVTIVVAAFMAGLGLGSLLGGWLAAKPRLPALAVFCAIEFATGAFGILSLTIFESAGHYTAALNPSETFALAFALVALPTLLMGASLPLLVEYLSPRIGNVGTSLGMLYFVNTLGAGSACLLCVFVLFPFLGLSGSVYVAVAINAVLAVLAVCALMLAPKSKPHKAVSQCGFPSAERAVRIPFVVALLFAAAGGLISLSYEIVFVRLVGFATGNSPAAFALVLAVFLFGIAFGAREAAQDCEPHMQPEMIRRAISRFQVAAIAGVLFLPVLGSVAWLDGQVLSVASPGILLVARAYGSLLPCLAASTTGPARAGTTTALLYLANICGSASGAILTGFVVMNWVGVGWAVAILAAASASMILLLTASLPSRSAQLKAAAFAASVAAAAMLILPGQAPAALAKLQWKGAPAARPIAKIVENRNGIITVTDDGTVFGDGMYDGRFNTDLKNDTNGIVRPYALSLFHPAPRDVLMIGLSSGSWAQVIANNPYVTSLTIVEINPGYLELIQDQPGVASLLSNPKVSIVIDDGRRWLRAHANTHFDAVVSNTTWYFRASVTNLLSSEFLRLVREHLKPGGVLFYNTTQSARAQRTGCRTFPYGARFTNHMVLSDAPIDWDFKRWEAALASYSIDGRPVLDMTRREDNAALARFTAWRQNLEAAASHSLDNPIELCRDVLARTGGLQELKDDNMGSEWRHFLALE